jgi:SHS2 domain-containing protein
MPYGYLEDIATADAAFEAWGATLEELFIAAADATMNVMVEDLDSIGEKECRPIHLEDTAIDMLLFQLLQELIFFKDAQQLLLRVSHVQVTPHEENYRLEADAYGEKLDPRRHELLVDVKAVTLHRFRVERNPEGWEATVILDI